MTSRSFALLLVGGLMWGCALSPASSEMEAASMFVSFERGGGRVACCAVALPSDGSIVVAGRLDPRTSDSKAWVAKVLQSGQVAWEKTPEGESTAFYGATETTGGAVIAVGQAGGAGLVSRIEPDGTTAWTRRLRLGDITKVTYVVNDPANGLLIGGAVATGAKPWSLFIARVTPSGEIGTTMSLGEGDGVNRMRRVDEPAGGYVVISTVWNVLSVDAAGQVRWKRTVNGALDAVGLTDGSVMVLTYPEGESTGAGLVRLGPDGATVWQRRVSDQAGCQPVGIWRLHDDVVLVGDPCDNSEHLVVVLMSVDGTMKAVHRIRLRAGVSAFAVRADAAGSVIAAGMFMQDGPDALKGWVSRSKPIRSLIP